MSPDKDGCSRVAFPPQPEGAEPMAELWKLCFCSLKTYSLDLKKKNKKTSVSVWYSSDLRNTSVLGPSFRTAFRCTSKPCSPAQLLPVDPTSSREWPSLAGLHQQGDSGGDFAESRPSMKPRQSSEGWRMPPYMRVWALLLPIALQK